MPRWPHSGTWEGQPVVECARALCTCTCTCIYICTRIASQPRDWSKLASRSEGVWVAYTRVCLLSISSVAALTLKWATCTATIASNLVVNTGYTPSTSQSAALLHKNGDILDDTHNSGVKNTVLSVVGLHWPGRTSNKYKVVKYM